ncbi:CopD family protein [Amorphus orientalis]|uniref:Copper resistance protein D n=1 Tax=Amorphus orientalis TaxID=649198 RepID=A0AAE3VQV3_9HYPH|nr:CopD family protein [Amorphus orientalis]MDQ0316293.1 putative copper resistance protein D [Amorphus orientalis]
MFQALAAADVLTWVSILVKASAYAATLLAAGSVLAGVSLRALEPAGRAALNRTAALSALIAALFTGLRLPLRAGFLMGGDLAGATDPMMLGVVADSPLGTSIVLRLVGLVLVLAVLAPGRIASATAVLGAVLVAMSFAFRGHALEEPRVLLGALVTLHILGLAFWVGAFAPLARAARRQSPAEAGDLSHEFGLKALWVVAALVVSGGLILLVLGAARPAALATPYGQAFAVKLTLFAGVLALAALNKLRLTPALRAGRAGAADRLRGSIRLEAALIALILLTTAALTTVTSPPAATTAETAPSPGPVPTSARALEPGMHT